MSSSATKVVHRWAVSRICVMHFFETMTLRHCEDSETMVSLLSSPLEWANREQPMQEPGGTLVFILFLFLSH